MDAYFGERGTTPPSTTEIRPRHAVIVYGDVGECVSYASVHRVTQGTNGKGRPRLEPGEPITNEFTRKFLASLGEDLKAEYLPASVLYRTYDTVVWWTPARAEEMRFRAGSELEKVSGRRVPLPALVWRLTEHGLAVRALVEDRRPVPSTRLHVAPFWNTAPVDGQVCEGSMRRPRDRGPGAVEAWDDAFFGSEFTHQAGAGSLTATSYVELLRTLVGSKESSFPSEQLVATSQTLADFATTRRR